MTTMTCPESCGYSFEGATPAETAEWLMNRHLEKDCPKRRLQRIFGDDYRPGRLGWPRPGKHVPRHVYVGPDRKHEVLVLVVDAEHVDAVSAWVVEALANHVDRGNPYPVELGP
jgi:hypothetical protein